MKPKNPADDTDILFSPLKIGDLRLPHRVVMAPLTRSRAAQPGDVPMAMNAEYYRQRASAALIISEATQVSPRAKVMLSRPAFTPRTRSPVGVM